MYLPIENEVIDELSKPAVEEAIFFTSNFFSAQNLPGDWVGGDGGLNDWCMTGAGYPAGMAWSVG